MSTKKKVTNGDVLATLARTSERTVDILDIQKDMLKSIKDDTKHMPAAKQIQDSFTPQIMSHMASLTDAVNKPVADNKRWFIVAALLGVGLIGKEVALPLLDWLK